MKIVIRLFGGTSRAHSVQKPLAKDLPCCQFGEINSEERPSEQKARVRSSHLHTDSYRCLLYEAGIQVLHIFDV